MDVFCNRPVMDGLPEPDDRACSLIVDVARNGGIKIADGIELQGSEWYGDFYAGDIYATYNLFHFIKIKTIYGNAW